MTDAKFKQLVNSFLDREISQKDHLLLSREVASSPQRRAEFERYKRLHAAERQALARLFAVRGDDSLGDEATDSLEGEAGEERRRMAEHLKARAARAWSEVQLLTVERKKRTLLIWQFVLAALALLFAGLALYRQSVDTIPGSGSYRKESEAINPESAHLAQLREQLLRREGLSVGWISNERGEPVALVGRSDEGDVFVMTSSELPRLSPTQLSTLLSQLPPANPTGGSAGAFQPATMVPHVHGPLRNRFVVSTRAASNALLPEPVEPFIPAAPPRAHASAQPRQSSQGAVFIGTASDADTIDFEAFWSTDSNFHTDIRTAPASEPQSD